MGVATPPPIPMPTPNAYVEMVNLGATIQNPIDVDEADESTLVSFVDAHASVLEELNKTVDHDSVVPIRYEMTSQPSLDRLSVVRNILRLRMAEAKLAAMQNRHADAANSYHKLIVAARQSQRGGFMLHKLTGAAYERASWEAIAELSDKLTANEKTTLLQKLQSIPVKNIGSYQDRERAASAKTVGRIAALMMRKQTADTFAKAEEVLREVSELEVKTLERLSK